MRPRNDEQKKWKMPKIRVCRPADDHKMWHAGDQNWWEQMSPDPVEMNFGPEAF